jgi:hypothetical protein
VVRFRAQPTRPPRPASPIARARSSRSRRPLALGSRRARDARFAEPFPGTRRSRLCVSLPQGANRRTPPRRSGRTPARRAVTAVAGKGEALSPRISQPSSRVKRVLGVGGLAHPPNGTLPAGLSTPYRSLVHRREARVVCRGRQPGGTPVLAAPRARPEGACTEGGGRHGLVRQVTQRTCRRWVGSWIRLNGRHSVPRLRVRADAERHPCPAGLKTDGMRGARRATARSCSRAKQHSGGSPATEKESRRSER